MQPVHRRPSSVWVDATLRGLDSTALGSTETSPVQNLRFTEIGNTCKIGEKTQAKLGNFFTDIENFKVPVILRGQAHKDDF